MTIVRELECKLNELIIAVNEGNAEEASNLNAAIALLTNNLNLALMNFENEIRALVLSSHDEGIVYDPTNGSHVEGFSLVLGRVYDYLRVFGYFAKQFDDLNMTAAQYDAHQYTARHFDLGITYPTLNDVRA